MYYLIFEPYIHDLTPFFYLVSLYSISFGAYGAVFQSRVHRLFGYSSINFMGFCIAAFFCIPANGFAAVLVNFVFYSFSTICFFYFYNRIQLPNQQLGELETVSQLGIVNRVSADVAIPLACFFLSLSGVPPFPGFFAKLLILNAAATSGHLLFVLVVSIINLFSYFYALRVVKVLFFSSESSLKARLFATFEGASRGRVVFLGCSAILI
jgi:NADH-quinone oxidoreductase subunit N